MINPEIQTKEYAEYNIKESSKEGAYEKLVTNEVEIYSEDIKSTFDLKERGFVLAENWSKSINLQAQVISISRNQVTCECLIDKENRKFETRMFLRELFSHLPDLNVKSFVLISIKTKPGSSRIDIYDGKQLVNEQNFNTRDMWDLLKNSGLDRPISFGND